MTRMSQEVLLILVLMLLNGALAMSEIAVVSARRSRMRRRAEQGDQGAAAALRLAEEPTRFLSTVQIGITLVGIFAGAYGGARIADEIAIPLAQIPRLAPYADAVALALVVVVITYLSLVIGELVPKRIGLANAESVAALVARPMERLSSIMGPAVGLLSASTDAVVRLLALRSSPDTTVTEEDVRLMIAEGTEAGVFEAAERRIVESAFWLGDQHVGELMTPRPRIVWLNTRDPITLSRERIATSPQSFYPVAEGELDRVVGVLALNRLSTRLLAGADVDLYADLVPPTIVPESMRVFQLVEVFRRAEAHIALVVDEHGTLVGLITPTDILEVIVGDFLAAASDADAEAVQRADGSWLLDGLLSVEQVEALFGLKTVTGEEHMAFRTVGGLMMYSLGKIPAAGDRVTWRGLRLEVMDMDGRRVDKVLATREDGVG